jgi:hypothetical protein
MIKMLIRKNNGIMTVLSGSHEWKVPVTQCFETENQKIYKLDNIYILFENQSNYGLMMVVDKCRKDDDGNV